MHWRLSWEIRSFPSSPQTQHPTQHSPTHLQFTRYLDVPWTSECSEAQDTWKATKTLYVLASKTTVPTSPQKPNPKALNNWRLLTSQREMFQEGLGHMPHWKYRAQVPSPCPASFPAHEPPFGRVREVQLSRCGAERSPLPEGKELLAAHLLSSASQGMAQPALPKGTPAPGARAGGVGTRGAALTSGGGPGPSPRQEPALRGGSQERVTGDENKAPPLGKASGRLLGRESHFLGMLLVGHVLL